MELENIKIGFAMCGSFCTFKKVIDEIENLKKTRLFSHKDGYINGINVILLLQIKSRFYEKNERNA